MSNDLRDVRKEIEQLLASNNPQDIEHFLRNPPIAIEQDEWLHQKVVVLHDRIGRIDPSVSAHVFWQRRKRSIVLDHRDVNAIALVVSAASVLDQPDAHYVVAGCDSTLDPACFPKGGLLQHIQQLEGNEFFTGPRQPPKPLSFLGVWDIASQLHSYRYLFINMKKNNRDDYVCSGKDILEALTRCLEHVAAQPQATIVTLPALGWHHLDSEDREDTTRQIIHHLEQFCKRGNTGKLQEIRLSLYSLEAALVFSKALNEMKQQHIENMNLRLTDARRLAGKRTDLVYQFSDPTFNAIRERVNAHLRTTDPLVFVGEPGVGKQFFAAYVHEKSPRHQQPFQVAGVRDSAHWDTWDTLRGGTEKTTGDATTQPPDRFMAAHRGTLFIKRLEHMPVDVQELMVNFLKSGSYYPRGSVKPKSLDVRVLFASRESLGTLVRRNAIIPDLRQLLEPYVIELPPLRRRPADIIPIARMWLSFCCEDAGCAVIDFDDEVKALFQSYDWPTNVDQLQSVVEVAVRYAQEGVITRKHVPLEIAYISDIPPAFARKKNLYRDYVDFRRAKREDWDNTNRELTNDAQSLIRKLLHQTPVGKPTVAALIKQAAKENGWSPARRVLVTRRVILGMFKIKKPKSLRFQGRTIRLLGYDDEGDEDTTQTGSPKRGALSKYLHLMGLSLARIRDHCDEDLFPEEVKMLDEVKSWKMHDA